MIITIYGTFLLLFFFFTMFARIKFPCTALEFRQVRHLFCLVVVVVVCELAKHRPLIKIGREQNSGHICFIVCLYYVCIERLRGNQKLAVFVLRSSSQCLRYTVVPFYVTIPSAKLKQSYKRGGLSSGGYKYCQTVAVSSQGELLDRGWGGVTSLGGPLHQQLG